MIKRKNVLVLAGFMMAAMLSGGCGKKAVETTAAETTQDVAKMDEELAQLANPVVEKNNIDEVSSAIGFDMIGFPEDMKVDQQTYFAISESLGEIRGTTAEGKNITIRKQKGDTDISGYFGVTFEPSELNGITVNTCEYEGTQVAWWVKGDFSYALTVEGIDEAAMKEILQKFVDAE